MEKIKKSKFIDEFREFISRGSVIDLAVGVIIGGAFQKIVTSLVNDIISPFLGMITGNASMATWAVTVNGAVVKYGSFIQSIIDFVLIAFFIFLFIKGVNILRRRQLAEAAAKAAQTPSPSREEELLAEIRDLIAKQSRD